MKKSAAVIFLSLMVLPFHTVFPEASKKPVPCSALPLKFDLPKKINRAFTYGENLLYSIKYQFVAAGQATLEVSSGPLINCRPTYKFNSTARSASFIDNFFMVRDFNSSTSDKDSLLSFFFHQNLREGGYRVIRNTSLDYGTGQYLYQKERKGKVTKQNGPVTEPGFDVLSAFYYIRTLPLELGAEYDVKVFSDGSIYHLKLKVHPKFEDVKVPAGTFECIRIEPKVVGDAIFKAKGGGMTIWLTSDDRRMPVLIRSKVAVGAFDAELRKFDTPQIDMVNEKVPS